ncbi:hypothetical protein M2140_000056 [Clostridiales Family XIII bacterium PM5-7]
MGTRGLWGFRKDDVDKLAYNHFDSNPDALGERVLSFIKSTDVDEMTEIFNNIQLVDEESTPTEENIAQLKKWADQSVDDGRLDNWYVLLRKTQGEPEVYKQGLPYMVDSAEFIKDSLFCEYAYVINIDKKCLEFWIGFQRSPQEENRYGQGVMTNYYPCRMLKTYSFEEITDSTTQEITDNMEREASDDYERQEKMLKEQI